MHGEGGAPLSPLLKKKRRLGPVLGLGFGLRQCLHAEAKARATEKAGSVLSLLPFWNVLLI